VDPTGKSVYAANHEDNGASPLDHRKDGDLVKITGGDAVRNEPLGPTFQASCCSPLRSSRASHALARFQLRFTVVRETPSTAAASSILRPPKNRTSTSWALLRIEFGEAAESFIQCDDIRGLPLGNSSRFFQKYLLKAVAALLRVMAAAVVDQDTPHQLCGDAQELLPIFPTNFSLIRQAKISLMHQGSSLQGVIAALPPQVARRQTPQFRVEQHDQLGRGLVIADTEFTQEGGNIWWRIHKDLIRDDRNRRENNGHRSSRNTASSKQRKS
jgi:hypothetical protein